MPLTPREAIVLTEENLARVDEFCRAIDAWLLSNRSEADLANRIYLSSLRLPLPCRKVQWAVARKYREAGWICWFDADPRRPFLYLAAGGASPRRKKTPDGDPGSRGLS